MHANRLCAIIAYLAVLTLAANSVDFHNDVFSAHHNHHNHHRSFDHPHPSLIKHNLKQQERHIPQSPNGPIYRCHDPHPEVFGPAPPVGDCDGVIELFGALTTDISVNLNEGCYQMVSGNCTGLVCPQRVGESTIPGALAAQYMRSPLRDECIANGLRGWWIDGQGWGVGVYLA
ncbi:hypothetical protein NUW58_g5002 [Xylaria curta]|uniref:Uncharacterized protein n=1 Tax=Xylaria curta TaxID=42375 RepID=A0ACC1P6S7_9PEZI|nr:hypothetical protein NUW58_g5002 [Xylaria curta]